jgi:hypothetical protein
MKGTDMTNEFKLFGGNIRSALVHAATEHDRKQAGKRGYNHYALAQYLRRIDEVCEDIEANRISVRVALINGFCDRLLDKLLVAVGEPKASATERR